MKGNRNIRESVRENEKQANDPVGSEANLKASEMGQAVMPSEVEARLRKVMESQGMNHDNLQVAIHDTNRVCEMKPMNK